VSAPTRFAGSLGLKRTTLLFSYLKLERKREIIEMLSRNRLGVQVKIIPGGNLRCCNFESFSSCFSNVFNVQARAQPHLGCRLLPSGAAQLPSAAHFVIGFGVHMGFDRLLQPCGVQCGVCWDGGERVDFLSTEDNPDDTPWRLLFSADATSCGRFCSHGKGAFGTFRSGPQAIHIFGKPVDRGRLGGLEV
jgi:hypothetical protein